jgi:hypothetical protein
MILQGSSCSQRGPTGLVKRRDQDSFEAIGSSVGNDGEVASVLARDAGGVVGLVEGRVLVDAGWSCSKENAAGA